MHDVNGFLILDKMRGCTSHDCVNKIRKLFQTKKVGHSGTLDPQVDGVLPIAIGKATRFIQYLSQEKTYVGTIKLGIKTVTDDVHGKIIREKDWPILSHNELDEYLNNFRGTFSQIPPKVSSVHIDGERAYKKILKNEEFELEAKEVSIKKLILQNWDQVNGEIDLFITCSAGTYIRAIARDIGIALNSEGCLLKLRRVKSSGFDQSSSYTFADLEEAGKNIFKFIIPISNALHHIPRITLKNKDDILFWQTGRRILLEKNILISNNTSESNKIFQVLDSNYKLIGMGEISLDHSEYLQPKLVLNPR
tara:strand:+ start:645 stop:1565 length:921 start_codon:yes stop_codon:yes gene_type:complete